MLFTKSCAPSYVSHATPLAEKEQRDLMIHKSSCIVYI